LVVPLKVRSRAGGQRRDWFCGGRE